MRSLVILSKDQANPDDGTLAPLASRADMLEQLSRRNTGPEKEGGDVVYGPGIRIELSPGDDPIKQMLLEIIDEDIAWDVIIPMARDLNWVLFDPLTGKTMSPS